MYTGLFTHAWVLMQQQLFFADASTCLLGRQVVRRVIDNLQRLDGLLKQQEPAESIQPLLREMQQQLGDLADIIGSMQ